MQPQNSLFNIWTFVLISVVLIAFLMLGADLNNLKWLHPSIGDAEAEKISAQTATQRERDQIETQKLQRQAEQELQAQAARDAEHLHFLQNLHGALVGAVRVIAILLGLGLFVSGIAAGIGLNRYLMSKAQAQQKSSSGETARALERLANQNAMHRRQLFDLQRQIAEQNAVYREQILNLRNQIAELKQNGSRPAAHPFRDTAREWPDDANDYLDRLPPSWAG